VVIRQAGVFGREVAARHMQSARRVLEHRTWPETRTSRMQQELLESRLGDMQLIV